MSAKLASGELVEMLFRGEETCFVVTGEEVREVAEVELPSGETLVPYSARNNLLTHRVVLFASAVGEYESATTLLSSIRTFIHRYVDLTPDFEAISSAYVLFTWVYDDFEEVPYLRVQGDYGCGKSRFLQSVGSLCYKPIFASGASTVSPLFRLLDAIQGTLILDESDFRFSDETAEIVKILNNGNAKGFPVLRSEQTPQKEFNPRAFRVFGPKVIATRRRFDDEALESRCLTEIMGRRTLRPDVPLNLPRSFHEEAENLRNKLLCFRLGNVGEERDLATLSFRGLLPRRAQVMAPLLSVLPAGEPRDSLARALGGACGPGNDAFGDGPRQVLEVLQELRREGSSLLSLKEIASRLEARASVGGDDPVTPRFVGGILRRDLGLTPVKSNGTYVLPRSAFSTIDGLVQAHGLVSPGDVGDNRDENRGIPGRV